MWQQISLNYLLDRRDFASSHCYLKCIKKLQFQFLAFPEKFQRSTYPSLCLKVASLLCIAIVDKAILVKPKKVAKSTHISLKGCIHRLIASSQLTLKEICDWFSYSQVGLMHPLKSIFKSMTLVHYTPNST